MFTIQQLGLAPGHDLGAVTTMAQFRASVQPGVLTADDRATLIQQATLLIEGLYVHLPLKRALYAIDPLQRLRLLRRRLGELTDARFHTELLQIFNQLRDLHTDYVLPAPYAGRFAFIGVLLEQCWRDGTPHWIVSKVWDHVTGDPALVPGAEVTHWNGAPMALALARHADQEAGSNPAARLARGLESMTFRAFAVSAPPDEDWVDLTYVAGGKQHETRIAWRVFASITELSQFQGDTAQAAGTGTPPSHLLGLDLRTELVRQVKAALFAPRSAAEEAISSNRPELRARTVSTAHGTFGHLRIFTFLMQRGPGSAFDDIMAFIAEVRRILALMPKEGLIIDVRGNGGGYVFAAEYLLQFLTPRPIQPEPTQFICTPLTAELAAAVDDFTPWRASISESVLTGAQHSSAFPLYDPADVNPEGQLYHGPVVLITDALCYSATDTFAAGFQDHAIGHVLGVDDATGAGGANVFTIDRLRQDWPAGPFTALPGGADLRVALRRTLRVAGHAGQVVEDFGVTPDQLHRFTERDLLDGNRDLLEHAGELLAEGQPRVLDVGKVSADETALHLIVTTERLSSLDVYADDRPIGTAIVLDGINTITLPLTAPLPAATLRVNGFDGDTLVAARTIADPPIT
jgi:Peptidase family S41